MEIQLNQENCGSLKQIVLHPKDYGIIYGSMKHAEYCVKAGLDPGFEKSHNPFTDKDQKPTDYYALNPYNNNVIWTAGFFQNYQDIVNYVNSTQPVTEKTRYGELKYWDLRKIPYHMVLTIVNRVPKITDYIDLFDDDFIMPPTVDKEKTCPICNEQVSSANFARHMKTYHQDNAYHSSIKESQKQCEICGKYITLSHFARHLKTHNLTPGERKCKTYVCQSCGKELSLKNKTRHEKTCNAPHQ